MVFEAAERGDEVALAILQRVAVLLGRLCANLVYALQPEKIVDLRRAGGTGNGGCWMP